VVGTAAPTKGEKMAKHSHEQLESCENMVIGYGVGINIGDVEKAVIRITDAIKELEAVSDNLESSIRNILRRGPIPEGQDAKPVERSCILSTELHTQADKLDWLVSRYQDFINRCEL
jgi:hypothetical protein